MKILNPILSFVLILTYSCTPTNNSSEFDANKERKAIIDMYKRHYEYIMTKNIKGMNSMPKPDSTYTVVGGQIYQDPYKVLSDEELAKAYGLANGNYLEMKEIEVPDIKFSKDGSQAWMLSKRKTVYEKIGDNGSRDTTTTITANMQILNYKNGNWIPVAIAITSEN